MPFIPDIKIPHSKSQHKGDKERQSGKQIQTPLVLCVCVCGGDLTGCGSETARVRVFGSVGQVTSSPDVPEWDSLMLQSPSQSLEKVNF